MTPQRWQRIQQILHRVWEGEPGCREQILDAACAQDRALREEVEALLASDDAGGDFLAHPAVEPGRAWTRIGPYRILREIGSGGMGTVFLAERADGQYRNQVAIKVAQSHLDGETVLRRFLQERQLLAGLDHIHIAKLLDGGATEDGLPYLVMEYVDGVPIDAWCESRKLPLRDRLGLFCSICEAVQYAHERHIIHRDIKPANILVTPDGRPVLLDFGIAKTLDPGTSPEMMQTTAGAAPMTPEYASPEQIRGEPVTPASDVYALGVVLYRLLTGALPYSLSARDPLETARVICGQAPRKPGAAAGLPGDLENIILMALRKEPERRYHSAAQLSQDLQRFLRDLPVKARGEGWGYRTQKFLKRNSGFLAASAAGAAIVLALVAALGGLHPPDDPRATPSIAVLPLENSSGQPEQDYVSDGITDALIDHLARIPTLRVISRTSAMSFKGLHKAIPEIARSLHVETIVEGSVLRTGNHVRISVRLIDGAKDLPIWSGAYDGEMSDAPALQDQVCEEIAARIHLTLTRKPSVPAPPTRVSLGAYDAYLKGRHQYFSGYSRESTEKAIAWFRQSLKLDAAFAPAYSGLAAGYWGLSSVYAPPAEVMPKVRWAAEKALQLDDSLGEAHGLLGVVRSAFEFNWDEAAREYRRALELKPGDAQIHLWYSMYLAESGRFDDAIAEAERAQELDPVSPFVGAYVGVPLYFARRYDQLIQRMLPVLELDPNQQQARAFLALAYEQKGEWDKAISNMEQAYALEKDQDGLAQLGHIYAVAGRGADARRILRQLKELARHQYVSAYNLGVLCAGLGDSAEAFRYLNQVEQDRSEWFAAINVDPRLDRFHSDPRFTVLLSRIGLRH